MPTLGDRPAAVNAKIAQQWEHIRRNAPVTAKEAMTLVGLVGSQGRTATILEVVSYVRDEELAALLNETWTLVEFPWRCRDILLCLFRRCDYIGQVPRPSLPVTVYRGVGSYRKCRGLSWTGSEERAEWFARRSAMFEAVTMKKKSHDGYIYTVTASPEFVLAQFTDRDEDEYVLDFECIPQPRRLRVVTHQFDDV